MNEQENEQFDPQLEALLDEALSAESVPGGVPTGLAERIIEKTGDSLATPHIDKPEPDIRFVAAATPERRGVIARIGPARIRALAAAIVLAASAGVLLMTTLIARDAREIVFVKSELRTLEQYEPSADPLGEELAMLDMQIQLALSSPDWSGRNTLLDNDLADLEWDVGTSDSESLF
ncbi:MAG: hypothetical protein HQ546_10730 [Planctomycetes bacterium]|nr:hypothetical protein [Planctomycetota bacterium]